MSYTDYIWFLHNCIQCFIFSVFAKHTLYSLSSQIQNGIDWGIVLNEISECISLATYYAVLNHLLSIKSYPLPNVHQINMVSKTSLKKAPQHKSIYIYIFYVYIYISYSFIFVSTLAFPSIFRAVDAWIQPSCLTWCVPHVESVAALPSYKPPMHEHSPREHHPRVELLPEIPGESWRTRTRQEMWPFKMKEEGWSKMTP